MVSSLHTSVLTGNDDFYLVNISELMSKYRDQVLSIRETDAVDGGSDTPSDSEYTKLI